MDEYESLKNEDISMQQPMPSEPTEQCFITCNKATVGWQSVSSNDLPSIPRNDRTLLENVTLNIRMGQVLGIIGQVGSGKVSILWIYHFKTSIIQLG